LLSNDPASLPPVSVPVESTTDGPPLLLNEAEPLLPSREPIHPLETWIVSMGISLPLGTAAHYDVESGCVVLYGTPPTHAQFERVTEMIWATERGLPAPKTDSKGEER
jgi:hypothetical protein